MTFTVTYEGNAAEDFVNATDTATYKPDYTFTLPNELAGSILLTTSTLTILPTPTIPWQTADTPFPVPISRVIS